MQKYLCDPSFVYSVLLRMYLCNFGLCVTFFSFLEFVQKTNQNTKMFYNFYFTYTDY